MESSSAVEHFDRFGMDLFAGQKKILRGKVSGAVRQAASIKHHVIEDALVNVIPDFRGETQQR